MVRLSPSFVMRARGPVVVIALGACVMSLYGIPKTSTSLDLENTNIYKVSTCRDTGELPKDVHSVWCGPMQAANGLSRGMLKHLHARTRAGLVNDRDGVSVHAVVHGAVRLWLLVDIAGSAVSVDDGHIQYIQGEAVMWKSVASGSRGWPCPWFTLPPGEA